MKALFAFLGASLVAVTLMSSCPKKMDNSDPKYQVVHGTGCSCGKGK